MSALTVTAAQATASEAAKAELKRIMEEGALVGASQVVAPVMSVGQFDMAITLPDGSTTPNKSQDAMEAILLAGIRAIAATETPWTNVTFINSWVDFGAGLQTVQYRKDSTGRVWLRGTMKRAANNYVAAFNLPAGFRPLASRRLNANMLTAGGGMDCYSSGDVAPFTYAVNEAVSLDGCSFETD